MTNAAQQPPAGWYPDPAGSDGDRYWDGIAWSQATRDRITEPEQPEAARPFQQAEEGAVYQPVQQVAGFGRRVPGFIIDFVIINFIVSTIVQASGVGEQLMGEVRIWMEAMLRWADGAGTAPLPMPSGSLVSAALMGAAINIGCFAIYRTVLLGTMGATLGQRVIGVRTVRVGGEPGDLGWGTAAVRGIAGAFLYQDLLIGFINAIFAATTKDKQTLSDMISKTHVLSIR